MILKIIEFIRGRVELIELVRYEHANLPKIIYTYRRVHTWTT